MKTERGICDAFVARGAKLLSLVDEFVQGFIRLAFGKLTNLAKSRASTDHRTGLARAQHHDEKEGRVEPGPNPFETKVLTMSSV